MFSWLRNVLTRKNDQTEEEYSEQLNQAKRESLEEMFGKSDDIECHATLPLFMGGDADVLIFREYVPGYTYVTSDLIGDDSQIKNKLGNYELMICTPQKATWAINLISRLARYTFEAKVRPGDTMDLDPLFPEDSNIKKLLFCVPEIEKPTFKVLGRKCGMLLCVGITPQEQEMCRQKGSEVILHKLKKKSIFPYSICDRESVV